MLRIALLSFVFVVVVAIAPAGARAQFGTCQPGTFSLDGYEPCTPCPPGYAVSISGAPFCPICPVGTAAPGEGNAQCVTCAPGTYADRPGSAVCQPCRAGTAVDYAGAPECSECPAGYYSDQPGMTQCLLCSGGTFSAQGGSTSCESCPAGTYNQTLGASSCTACAPGTASATVGAFDPAACIPCAAGRYASGAGQTSCSACPRNSYASSTGSAACVACGCDDGVACTRDTCDATTAACSAPRVTTCRVQEVAFTGEVTYVDPFLGSTIVVGDAVEGLVRWDPEAPDHSPMDATYGDHPGALQSFDLAIGAGPAVSATSPGGSVSVLNDSGSGDRITFATTTEDGLAATPIETNATWEADLLELIFWNPAGTTLASDAIPAGPIDFAAFPSRTVLLEYKGPLALNAYIEAAGVIDAPEPHALLAAATAIAAVAGLRRRR